MTQVLFEFNGGPLISEKETVDSRESKKHDAHPNSIEAFRKYNRDRRGSTGTVIVIAALKEAGQPLTRRQLSEITKLEIGNLCRILYDAVRAADPIIRIAYSAPCPITKNKASYYSLTDEVEPL